MIAPGRPALFAATLLAVALLAAVVVPGLIYVALAGDLLIVAICLIEGRRLARSAVHVQREDWRRLQLGRETDMVYRVENRGRHTVTVTLRQPWPQGFEAASDRTAVTVAPGEIVRVAITVTPRKRGRVVIAATEIDISLPRGFARFRRDLKSEAVVSVYPDLQSLCQYDNLRRHHALRQLGIHRRRLLGRGWEFEQLREYLPDDDFRDINWKATARRRRPMTNCYRTERSQDVLLCLDCGRMMGNPVGSGAALDRAVDASVMLAHVAGRQGDRVGLVLFKETVSLFLKPKAGTRPISRIVEELVDAAAEPVFPSYGALVKTLRVSHKRRSVIFIFTDLNDPQIASDLADVLPLLSRRHVVVVVSLRDPLVARMAGGPARDAQEVYEALAARMLATERDTRARELADHGVQVLEADADALTMDVINRYLDVKMRQLI